MFYIYEKSSTYIMGKLDRWGRIHPDHRQSYKTLPAAKAALTRMSTRHQAAHKDSENDPRVIYAIAEAGVFHATLEKTRTVYSIMDQDKLKPIVETVNTPGYMSPSSESYWSM